MKVNTLGAGPGGLYASLLLKKAHPTWDIAIWERNPAGATYGWGVVFSDQTLTALREADYRTYTEIISNFVIWDAIDVHFKGELVRCTGHIFAGIARKHLLHILASRCEELAIPIHWQTEVEDPATLADADLLIAADGVNSRVRALHADAFKPSLEHGRAKYIWYGTHRLFDSFTFIFRQTEHGLFQVHAYPFDGTTATFIVECEEATWHNAGLDEMDEAESIAFCETLFTDQLQGHALLSNNSRWISFVTLKNRTWRHNNIVLLGDAAHTAHFSIGSGTKLALEDAIALANGFERHPGDQNAALREYEQSRRPKIEAFQKAATDSQSYFENVSRYQHFAPLQFTFHLLTRSGRITYDNLKQRDPYFVSDVERWFAHPSNGASPWLAPSPMFIPLKLREVALPNRVVLTPSPADTAEDGTPGERHAAQLANLALGGAGLVLTEPVAVSREGRITSGSPGLYSPEHANAWAGIVSAIHEQSPARIALTLSHAGRRGSMRPRSEGVDRPLREGNWPLLSASAIPYMLSVQIPREMSRADMDEVRALFVQAARWADEAGFDLLVLDAARGYLLASFLSPLTNQRADGCGGSLENRVRYPCEVVAAVRAVWPEDKPLAVALTATDCARDGSDVADAIAVASAFKARGCDLILAYAGQTVPFAHPIYDARVLSEYSDRIRNEVSVPTMATGYITTSDEANTILTGGRADLSILHPRGMAG
ncbi:MAG TPA: FAD-dependent monooxygenase [Ardenticatenaceae bacterium]